MQSTVVVIFGINTTRVERYGVQLVPPNFYHQVSFSRRQFSLARLFFSARLFFRHDCFFRHDFLFSARPGQVTADQYYRSGMENKDFMNILATSPLIRWSVFIVIFCFSCLITGKCSNPGLRLSLTPFLS